jgi:hypothetical protein
MRVDVLGSSLETGMLYKHGRDPEKGAPMKRRRRTLIRVIGRCEERYEDPNYLFSESGG